MIGYDWKRDEDVVELILKSSRDINVSDVSNGVYCKRVVASDAYRSFQRD